MDVESQPLLPGKSSPSPQSQRGQGLNFQDETEDSPEFESFPDYFVTGTGSRVLLSPDDDPQSRTIGQNITDEEIDNTRRGKRPKNEFSNTQEVKGAGDFSINDSKVLKFNNKKLPKLKIPKIKIIPEKDNGNENRNGNENENNSAINLPSSSLSAPHYDDAVLKKKKHKNKKFYPSDVGRSMLYPDVYSTRRRSAPIFSRRLLIMSPRNWSSKEDINIQRTGHDEVELSSAEIEEDQIRFSWRSPQTPSQDKNNILSTLKKKKNKTRRDTNVGGGNIPNIEPRNEVYRMESETCLASDDKLDGNEKRDNKREFWKDWGNSSSNKRNATNMKKDIGTKDLVLAEDVDEELDDVLRNSMTSYIRVGNSSQHQINSPLHCPFSPELNNGRNVHLFLDEGRSHSVHDYGSVRYKSRRGIQRPLSETTVCYCKKHDDTIINEKTPLIFPTTSKSPPTSSSSLSCSSSSSSSTSSSSGSSDKTEQQTTKTAVYMGRWYLLLIFSFFSMIYSAVWSTWGPIAQSAKAAFSWDDSNITMFTWVANFPMIIMIFPIAYMMDVKGLRVSMILCCGLTFLGTGLRCLSSDGKIALWLNYGGQFLNGIAGVVPMSGSALFSGLWFPANQRATATAISIVSGYLGSCVSFIVGPLVVTEPEDTNPVLPINTTTDQNRFSNKLNNGNDSTFNTTNVDVLKDEIMAIMYGQCGAASLCFLLVLVYFPSKPPLPPSISASIARENYLEGIKKLVRNKQFWLTVVAYGLPVGVYEVWQVVLDVILNPRVSQETAGWLDLYSTLGGCTVGLLISRFADHFTRHMKLFLLVFYCFGSAAILWFTLVVDDILPFDTVCTIACILIGVCLDGSGPLFIELVTEVSYPVGEGVTSGLLQVVTASAGCIFLALLQVRNLGNTWVNWCFLGCSVLSVPLLALISNKYSRADVDDEEEDDDDDDDDDEDEEVEEDTVVDGLEEEVKLFDENNDITARRL